MTLRILAAAVAAILPLGALHATTVVVPFSLNGSGTTALTPFDTSLGTLTSVGFNVSATFNYNWTATAGASSQNELSLSPNAFPIFLIDSETTAGPVSLYANDISMSGFVFVSNIPAGQTVTGTAGGGGSKQFAFFSAAELDAFKAGFGLPKAEWIAGGGSVIDFNDGIASFSGNFSNFNLTGTMTYTYTVAPVTPPGGVIPEPASWALMIAGFGLVGAAARRKSPLARTAN